MTTRRDYRSALAAPPRPSGAGRQAIAQGLSNLAGSISNVQQRAQVSQQIRNQEEAKAREPQAASAAVSFMSRLNEGAKESINYAQNYYLKSGVADEAVDKFKGFAETIREGIASIEDSAIRDRVLEMVEPEINNHILNVSSQANDYQTQGINETTRLALTQTMQEVSHVHESVDFLHLSLNEQAQEVESLKSEFSTLLESYSKEPDKKLIRNQLAETILRITDNPDIDPKLREALFKELPSIDPSQKYGDKIKAIRERADRREEQEQKEFFTSTVKAINEIAGSEEFLYLDDRNDARNFLHENVGPATYHRDFNDVLEKRLNERDEYLAKARREPGVRDKLASNHPDVLAVKDRVDRLVDREQELKDAYWADADNEGNQEMLAAIQSAQDRTWQAHKEYNNAIREKLESWGNNLANSYMPNLDVHIDEIVNEIEGGTSASVISRTQSFIDKLAHQDAHPDLAYQLIANRTWNADPRVASLIDVMAMDKNNPHLGPLVDSFREFEGDMNKIRSALRDRMPRDEANELIDFAERRIQRDPYFQYLLSHNPTAGATYRAGVIGIAALQGSPADFRSALGEAATSLGRNVGTIATINGKQVRMKNGGFQQDRGFFSKWLLLGGFNDITGPSSPEELQYALDRGFKNIFQPPGAGLSTAPVAGGVTFGQSSIKVVDNPTRQYIFDYESVRMPESESNRALVESGEKTEAEIVENILASGQWSVDRVGEEFILYYESGLSDPASRGRFGEEVTGFGRTPVMDKNDKPVTLPAGYVFAAGMAHKQRQIEANQRVKESISSTYTNAMEALFGTPEERRSRQEETSSRSRNLRQIMNENYRQMSER